MDEDTENETESTEIVADRDAEEVVSIRDTLESNLRQVTELRGEESEDGTPQRQVQQQQQQQSPQHRVPPADMRKEEREAWANPTPENIHIIQDYTNRRSYETRSDYTRKMQEVEQLRKENAAIYDAVGEHRDNYAKNGINIADVTRRSIAWDRSMQEDPIATARDWLDSYGLSMQDLMQPGYEEYQAPPEYLTRAEAEQIAEQKFEAVQAAQQEKAVEYYNGRVVESFMNSKPLFRDPETSSQLEAEMAPLVTAFTQSGRYGSPEEILETAYNYVVGGNPTFAGIASKMAARSGAQATQAASQKARAASRSISGSAGSGTPTIATKDIRDNLRRRFSGGD